MSKYIRVRGQLYQAVDAVNEKMLNYLMSQLKPILSSLSVEGYVFSQKPTAKGVDIILHREGSVADVADARDALKHARTAIYSIEQKVQKISELPFFKDRYNYDLGVVASAKVYGRWPWKILSIEANQQASMSEVLSHYQEMRTPKSQKPSDDDLKDHKAIYALNYLQHHLRFTSLIKNLDFIQDYAKDSGRLEPQLASDVNNFIKSIKTQSNRLVLEIKNAYKKYERES